MKQISLFETKQEADLVDIAKASEILGVSTATIRNWIKTGEISYASTPNGAPNGKSRRFDQAHIEQFKAAIENGKTSRLNNRANKRNSAATFIPVEQLTSRDLLPLLQSYIDLINKHQLPIQVALLIHSLSVLKKAGLATYGASVTSVNDVAFKNKNIKKVILEWDSLLGKVNLINLQDLLSRDDIFSSDSLGILYQSLLDEGKKSQVGSYYTPQALIEDIVDELSSQTSSSSTILDPCCGTGQFLIAFSKYITNPLGLWGYDIDPIATQIAKINLLTSYPETDFYPNIFVADSLTDHPDGEFDLIATNPPWGYHFSKDERDALRKKYPTIVSNEAFSYFLVRGLNLLADDGFLCYIVPEAITKVKQHRDVRDFLLRHSSIKSIKHLGNVFSKVLSPVMILNIQKSINPQNEVEVTQADGSKTQIKQARFMSNADATFDTSITAEDEQLIAEIYKQCFVSLKSYAEWALGIVTGNNRRFVSNTKTNDNEGVLKGSDLQKYTYKPASSFLNFVPDDFQQVAPVWKYRANEKLIYKFISSELVFAYDDKQALTLNSANILIPKIPGIPIKVVLAFLNSTLFQYLHKKKFNTVKILRGDLEQLPFPQMDDKAIAKIERGVDSLLLLSGTKKNDAEDELNELIFDAFKVSEVDRQYINHSIRK